MILISSFGSVKSPERDELIKKTQRMLPLKWNFIPLRRCPDQRTSHLLPEEKSFLEKYADFYLLDVQGKTFDSETFSNWLTKTDRHLVIGPAIGFHSRFFKQAAGAISLSSLTFTHGLAQLILAETLYRSACILNNHPFVK